MATQNQFNTKLRYWIMAIRVKTLPASMAPVVVGTGVVVYESSFHFSHAFIALIISVLLQIGANLANDVYDHYRGVDSEERSGPIRVTQAGYLTPDEVKQGMFLVFLITALLGIYLAINTGWIVLVIGALAIISAITYSGGPLPYGYHGLGDLFVFIFFGLGAVNGTYYIQAGKFSVNALIASLPMGLLITAILVVNNLRDIQTDRDSGKRTLAVMIGKKLTQYEFILCLVISYLVPFLFLIRGFSSVILLPLLTFPLGVILIKAIYKNQGEELNHTLAGTGLLVLLYGLLQSLGFIFS